MCARTVLRKAQPHEHEALSRLAFRSKAFWGYTAAFMQACQAELTVSADSIRQASRRTVVASANDLLVGFYVLSDLGAPTMELEAMFVEPGCIGSGVGRLLFDDAVRWARSSGAQSIVIQADPHALGFYTSMGAIRTGERESDSLKGRFLPELRFAL